ncbi:MAG: biotin--[acetyl-CoA-carboxylase] ligase [Alphaproteobacteria bacterium]|nr:biotin--[acetyl-CoA-carboxylase] ligase [Alphaproteobacteria bacterium]
MSSIPDAPPGWRLIEYDSIDSTSDEARRLAEAGEDGPVAVWAREQTAGRGRHGRSWTSPKGNFYLSVLLRPGCPTSRAPEIGFVVGVAMARAAREVSGVPVVLKWPNDLLADGRKVAGILLDSADDGQGRVAWVVAGTGVNVASHPDGLPDATSLSAQGYAGTVEDLVAAYIRALAEELEAWERDGFLPIRERWSNHALPQATPLSVKLPDGVVEGDFGGLDETGSLLLRRNGETLRISVGDVFPLVSPTAA